MAGPPALALCAFRAACLGAEAPPPLGLSSRARQRKALAVLRLEGGASCGAERRLSAAAARPPDPAGGRCGGPGGPLRLRQRGVPEDRVRPLVRLIAAGSADRSEWGSGCSGAGVRSEGRSPSEGCCAGAGFRAVGEPGAVATRAARRDGGGAEKDWGCPEGRSRPPRHLPPGCLAPTHGCRR